ncbi:MAG: dethiobiotin synthase [Cycloclasticus sp. symbiont of Poecilosclerida sp. M]|nr:MAG: dethiobiotin synthase [Cycloclasticus sp. symbiont of Poecilosclerida sp. M]
MKKGFFITGTDTEVGKTYVAVELMRLLSQRNKRVIGFKPVAAGAAEIDGVLMNSDACQLLAHSTPKPPYALLNPYCFKPAIAPHIAADATGETIEIEKIQSNYEQLEAMADVMVVEGAGGWATPINNKAGLDDVAKQLNLPIILVVGLKLGCINHALLTEAAIIQKGCTVIAWIGNEVLPAFKEKEANVLALKSRLQSPCLGVVSFQPGKQKSEPSEQINTQLLLDYLVDFS